ncbi:carbon-nitrogen hydrolase family protein [Chloroflexota bacterium]
MGLISVALLQMISCGIKQNENQEKGEVFCRRASEMGADIALFPEMWNVGYSLKELNQLNLWSEKAISNQDAFIRHFQRLARELQIAIVLTYLEKWDNAPRNSLSIIDRYGNVSMTYAKVHTCDFDLESSLTFGDGFPICAIDTAKGQIIIGAMICYDREFPESARILMLKGAEIILVPNACTLDSNRIGQFKTRAFENMVGMAMTNYAAPQENGHSIAFDGIAYDENSHTLDMLLVEAGEEEGIYLAEFDMDKLRSYRKREVWGNAYRKPRYYSPLTSLDVQEPFKREDARR